MAASSDSEEESFVELGRALPFIEGEGKKPISLQDAPKASKDSKGRPRFHGAFTGGFSAGYFNSVGSKEGWTPSTFVSSRTKRQDGSGQKPEDFMDDEDFGEHGIAPRKFVTSAKFTSEEQNRKRRAEAVAATRDTILPAAPALVDLIVPEKIPVGIKLLQKMGWKEGQGIGPRVKSRKKKRKENKDPGVKVYGCMLPPAEGDKDSESSDAIDLENVTFAPKDVTPISLTSKDNVHGLGYCGLDPRSALPSTHVDLFELAPTKSTKSRKGIRGQAFGVGALEDEDEDIYAADSLSNYDQTMEIDDSQQLFGWTAPGSRTGKGQPTQQRTPVGYVGKLLEGFTLSAKLLPQKKVFAPTPLPQGFRPFHKFKKTPQQLAQEALGETPSTLLRPANQKLNAVERGVMLGETPVATSVFDLIPKEDVRKMAAVKEAAKMASSRFQSACSTSFDNLMTRSDAPTNRPAGTSDQYASRQEDRQQNSTAMADAEAVKAPLFQGNLSLQPFRKDPTKQERYDRYLALVRQGVKDPYEQVTSASMTEWERQRERDEFAKAAKIFKPLSNMMASRFTRGAFIDDSDQTSRARETDVAKSDQAKAAEMKMFGQLTHEEFEWHPHNLLCKRFNVPNPYPGSEIVGLLGVKRGKFSVFNFLSAPTDRAASQKDKEKNVPKAIEASSSLTKQMSATKSKPGALSIFSVLDEKQSAPSSGPTNTKASPKENEEDKSEVSAEDRQEEEEEEKPDVDLFRAIFKNSDSESSSSSDKSDDDNDDASLEKTSDKDLPSVTTSSSVIRSEDKEPESKTTSAQEVPEKGTAQEGDNRAETVLSQPPSQPVSARQKSRSRWGGSIFDVLDQSPPHGTSSMPQSAVEERLSPPEQQEQPSRDLYGPALPPPSSTAAVSVTRAADSEPTQQWQETRHGERDGERSRHRHKKEKKKKSKHKKEKRKKKEKKVSRKSHSEKRKGQSSGSEADSETESDSD